MGSFVKPEICKSDIAIVRGKTGLLSYNLSSGAEGVLSFENSATAIP